MKFININLLLFFISSFLPLAAISQNTEQADTQAIVETIELPPLSVLIDSALAYNPMVRFRELGITGKQCNLNTYRNDWTRNLGLQADVRYGTFDNFSTNTNEGQSPSVLATRSNQSNWGVGAYIKFPLQDAVNRKNLIKMAKSELDQAESMAQEQRDEVRQLVIRQYNDVVLKQRILAIRSKNFSTSRINMEMVEKEFQNGVVSVTEYSRISDIVAHAEADYEIARTDYITTYMVLEEIVGFNFRTTKTSKPADENN